MKNWQYLLGGFGVLLIALQFVPNELPVVDSNNPGDLIGSGIVSDEVAGIFKKSCYDCHSNETKFPWYSHVAPFSWLLAKDIREGREELNFSNWADYDLMDKLAKLDDMYSEVKEKHMPLPIYTFIHWDAKLSQEQRQKIMEWAETTMDIIAEEDDSDF
jgi:hypothetical protein